MEGTRPLTFGEKAVGLNFNPGGNPDVNMIKTQCAALIDFLDETRKTADAEKARLCSIAITEIQGAQMWAVKAVTFNS